MPHYGWLSVWWREFYLERLTVPQLIAFLVAFAPDITVKPSLLGRIETTMLERNFKKNQREDFEAMGWIFIQLVADSGIPMGFPDTLCISPTGYSCYVEWKKSKNAKKQPLQKYWNKRLNDMGHDAFFVYPSNVEEWRDAIISKSRKLPS